MAESRTRWFLVNLAILLALDVAASAVVVTDVLDEPVALSWLWDVPLLGLIFAGISLVAVLPGFLVYLAALWRRRSRRNAFLFSPLLLLATSWTYGGGDLVAMIAATACIPLAALLVRV